MGWPMATAPPLTLTFAGSRRSSRITASAARQTLRSARRGPRRGRGPSRFLRGFSRWLRPAPSSATSARCRRPTAPRCAPSACCQACAAVRSLVTTTAAAPSLVPGALPAVTVPSFLNAGRSLASASSEASGRGDSSRRTTMGSPFFCGTSIGNDLRFDVAGVHRAHGALVAFERELVLLLARDFVFFGDEFGGHAHVEVVVNVPQSVVNHGVDDFGVAECGSRCARRAADRGSWTSTPCRRRRRFRLSPSITPCAASATALRPEPQTLLMVMRGDARVAVRRPAPPAAPGSVPARPGPRCP